MIKNLLNKLLKKIKKNKKEFIVLVVLLIISGVAHGYNMFHYPYYENDEGVYMSQALSLLTEGKFAPYTYWYDHAPAGWMLIALWIKITGGVFTFGTSINSGRALMFLLHLATSYLLFYIAKRLSRGHIAGIIAVLLFSLSPLGIYFQRRILLDNIMIFWVLLSLALLLKKKLKLSHIIISAISFGIAVLTKENAIFFTPAFLYVIHTRSHIHHKSLALVKWLVILGLIVSTYFLYALLKGELFPVGFLGDYTPRVSLLSTLQAQASRGEALVFWSKSSDFYINLMEWLDRDFFTITIGILAVLINIIVSIKNKSLRIPSLFAATFFLFLMRGKLVIDFYIVPLIPILSLNTGLLLSLIYYKLSSKKKLIRYLLALFILTPVVYFPLSKSSIQYIQDETISQVNTIEWIKENLSEEDKISIDNAIYVDLRESRYEGDVVFPNADWFWKLELDPEIRQGKYHNNWQEIEYIVLSHETVKQMKQRSIDFLKKGFDNSQLITVWKDNSSSYINLDNYISTNGDWMAIYKVKSRNNITLDSSWKFYKENFIKSYGQIINPNNNDVTTSEGQSYAMLRAVWQNDKNTFDSVWMWTKDHLQFRNKDKLFSWLWEKDGDSYKLGDSGSASDADQDIALALAFAYKQWGNENHLESAKVLLADIWKQEVVLVNGRYYLASGAGAERDEGFLVNPSYLSPAHYRIFAEVDKQHPWEELADDSYYLLNKIGEERGNSIYLPPNWILVNKNTGNIVSASKYVSDKDVDNYGFDAFRTTWRVGLDAVWFNNSEAIEYLDKVSPFFAEQWKSNGKISAVYAPDGKPKTNFESLSTDVGALSVFTVTDSNLADEFYRELFNEKFNDQGYWGDQNNYYDQNWAWFGTALYSDNLPNLWFE